MATGLHLDHRPEGLRRPVLVAGFEGWNDAADAASNAAAWITQHGDAVQFATIDPEEYFDFQSRRPEIELVDGVTRTIRWPENQFYTVAFEERDLVVLRGAEPSYRWQQFCATVLDVAKSTGCEMVVTFGALLADVPHTREARVTGTATDTSLVPALRLSPSTYEGPTGIVGVLQHSTHAAGIGGVSLWAPVPHYVAAPPNPVATLALLERFTELVGVRLDLERLEQMAAAWRTRVDEIAAGDPDVAGYISRLEERFDREEAGDGSWVEHLPTGDELARELEQFLRDQRGQT